jgi:hypothetical protein
LALFSFKSFTISWNYSRAAFEIVDDFLGENVRSGDCRTLQGSRLETDGQEKTPNPFARRRFELTGTGRLHGVPNC